MAPSLLDKVVRVEILRKIGEGLQDRESGDRNTDRSGLQNLPANPDFWRGTGSFQNGDFGGYASFHGDAGRPTKKRFRTYSGTEEGCRIAESSDPTTWIAILTTMLLETT
ncbi:hypothetical protein L195_g011489 [Trifolium pratense]|uniref:Uncharacterized protein n=1 Tax=Trifolium pratense TaxID=57577 RepID=A0A2K3PHN1_TRIPR|nr:hypothetical protein L195_g011489 [Trifolium pratense]